MGLWLLAMVIGLLLTVSGCRMLRTGWRGIRVSTDPVCVVCEYDVDAAVPVCPECGKDLTEPGAVAFGKRRRHAPMVIGSLVLLLLGGTVLFPAVVAGSSQSRRVVQYLKPTGWLLNDLESTSASNPAHADMAGIVVGRLSTKNGYKAMQAMASGMLGPVSYSSPQYRRMLARLESASTSDPVGLVMLDGLVDLMSESPGTAVDTFADSLGMIFRNAPADSEIRTRLAESVIASARAGLARYDSFYHAFQREAAQGRIPLDLVERYFRAGVRPRLVVAGGQPVAAGDAVRVEIPLGVTTQMGTRVACSVEPTGESAGLVHVGRHVRPVVPGHQSLRAWNGIGGGQSQLRWWLMAPRVPGSYEVTVDLVMRIYELEERGSAGMLATSFADPARLGPLDSPTIEIRIPLRTTMEVVAADPAAGMPRADQAAPREEVLKPPVRWGGTMVWRSTAGDLAYLHIQLPPPDHTVSADVILRQGEREWDLGWLYVPAGTPWEMIGGVVEGIEHGPCQVVLRPTLGELIRPTGIQTYVGREIVIDTHTWSPDPAEWDDGGYYDWDR